MRSEYTTNARHATKVKMVALDIHRRWDIIITITTAKAVKVALRPISVNTKMGNVRGLSVAEVFMIDLVHNNQSLIVDTAEAMIAPRVSKIPIVDTAPGTHQVPVDINDTDNLLQIIIHHLCSIRSNLMELAMGTNRDPSRHPLLERGKHPISNQLILLQRNTKATLVDQDIGQMSRLGDLEKMQLSFRLIPQSTFIFVSRHTHRCRYSFPITSFLLTPTSL